MNSINEKKRSPNFTHSEKVYLFKLVVKYASILGRKKNDKATIVAKNRVWNKIHQEFNAVSPALVYRSPNTLKLLFENKKRDLRRKATRIRVQTSLKECENMPQIEIDAIDEKLLGIIEDKSLSLDNMDGLDSGIEEQSRHERNANNLIKSETDSVDENFIFLREMHMTPKPQSSNGELDNNKTPTFEDQQETSSVISEPHWSSRRNSDQSSSIPTFPDVELKYKMLMNKKLLLLDKRIELINMEKEHLLKESKLKLELLRLQVAAAKAKLVDIS